MSKQKEKGYRFEKAIESYLCGERKGTLGKEDVAHPVFSIECKVKNNIPKGVSKDYGQALNNAPKGKIPMVVWHEDHQRHDNDIVFLRAADFRMLFIKEFNNAKRKKPRVETEEKE
jgi:hypothetical protein